MAEEYVLIDDIIKNHTERILNLRKFYPFFSITEGAFNQYKEGRFKFLDMGYITLAVLRYFINENSFKDSPVSYKGYSDFCRKTLVRDFDISIVRSKSKSSTDLGAGFESETGKKPSDSIEMTGENADYEDNSASDREFQADEIEELIRFIFDKLRNGGRAFEFSFYDPAEKRSRVMRVRLIDSVVKENEVVYSITQDGIEFYLTTKEVRDESRINMEQLLLEKMIRSENFRGSLDVIERINIEVKALDRKREEVMQLLLTDVHAGVKAVDEYMDRTTVWFAEERKSFAKNRELLDKAVAKLSFGDDSRTARDISKLQNMLKQTIENHSALIASSAELSRFSDEMVRRSRTRSLRVSYDFENVLNRIIRADSPETLAELVLPFMLPRRRKTMSVSSIDNVILQKNSDSLKGEMKDTAKADLSFRYDDEIMGENIGRNFARLFVELLGRLKRWGKVTLQEYNAILEVKFGEEIYKNRDYYSFLTHLAGKTRYSMKSMLESQETFLEDMVIKYMSENEKEEYSSTAFEIKYGDEEIILRFENIDDIADMTELIFERI